MTKCISFHAVAAAGQVAWKQWQSVLRVSIGEECGRRLTGVVLWDVVLRRVCFGAVKEFDRCLDALLMDGGQEVKKARLSREVGRLCCGRKARGDS